MNKNNKGFSLVELIVSFVIITILSLAVFRTALSIQSKQVRNIAYNNYLSFQNAINTNIQTDLTTKVIEVIEYCGKNCYNIKFSGGEVKQLFVDQLKNTIKYNDNVEKLPKSFSFYTDIEVNEKNFEGIAENKYNSIITIRIPVKSTILVRTLDLVYIYQYDNRMHAITSKIS